MSDNLNQNSSNSSQQEPDWRRHFPHAGWWLGVLPDHPEIHGPQPAPMPQPVAAPNPPEPPPWHYAPPPGPPPSYYSDPPPPYQCSRLDAPAVPPIYPQLAAQHANLQGLGAAPVTSMRLSIPRNTGVTGAIVSRVTLVLPTDLPFIDFFDRVCAHMDLHPANTEIGYKYHTDRVREPAHRLLNEEELREAMFIGIDTLKDTMSRNACYKNV
ncbi:hypothetical protein B0H21DRAFT_711743 [Amylocystis lapponica]|nr:hypothetical protein B0H21DRAFT_711743 [Amylocystis lapponica]